MKNYLIASITVLALTVGSMYQSINPSTQTFTAEGEKTEQNDSKPETQNFVSEISYNPQQPFSPKPCKKVFTINFQDMDISDSMSDENGTIAASWSGTGNLDAYTVGGIVTSVTVYDPKSGTPTTYSKK